MRRVLFKIVIPLILIGLWMQICYYACNTDAGLDTFKYWILCGFPFGLRRMWLWLVPVGMGIQGIAVFALDFIVAGIIGGFVLAFHLVKIAIEIVRVALHLLSAGRIAYPVED